MVTLFNEILNQRSEVVCTVEAMVLMAMRAAAVVPVLLAPKYPRDEIVARG